MLHSADGSREDKYDSSVIASVSFVEIYTSSLEDDDQAVKKSRESR